MSVLTTTIDDVCLKRARCLSSVGAHGACHKAREGYLKTFSELLKVNAQGPEQQEETAEGQMVLGPSERTVDEPYCYKRSVWSYKKEGGSYV